MDCSIRDEKKVMEEASLAHGVLQGANEVLAGIGPAKAEGGAPCGKIVGQEGSNNNNNQGRCNLFDQDTY